MEHVIITILIIAVTAAVTIMAFNNRSLLEKTIFSVGDISDSGEFYRVLSSMFIHENMGHLAFNMFSFYAFAADIERIFGPAVTALIYLFSGISAGVLSLFLHRKEKYYRSLGASGGVCGIIFASIFLIPGGSIIVFPLPIPIPAWGYAILFVFGSIYAANRMPGGIAHDAHLGGSLAGIIAAGIVDFKSLTGNIPLLSAVVVPIIIFFIFNRRIGSLMDR